MQWALNGLNENEADSLIGGNWVCGHWPCSANYFNNQQQNETYLLSKYCYHGNFLPFSKTFLLGAHDVIYQAITLRHSFQNKVRLWKGNLTLCPGPQAASGAIIYVCTISSIWPAYVNQSLFYHLEQDTRVICRWNML